MEAEDSTTSTDLPTEAVEKRDEEKHLESLLQMAIIGSLHEYCFDQKCHHTQFSPYARQQGFGPGQFCADLVAQIATGHLLLLELKYRTKTGSLPQLNHGDGGQHAAMCQFQDEGIPVAYGFNMDTKLAYYQPKTFDPTRGEQTLKQIARVLPHDMSSKVFKTPEGQESLFDWLKRNPTALGGAQHTLAVALGCAARPDFLTNSALFFIYKRDDEKLREVITLTKEDLVWMGRWLKRITQVRNTNPKPELKALVDAMTAIEARLDAMQKSYKQKTETSNDAIENDVRSGSEKPGKKNKLG